MLDRAGDHAHASAVVVPVADEEGQRDDRKAAERDAQIPVRYVGPDRGVVGLADKEQISQVFVNIIKNAIQAISSQPSNVNGDIIVTLNPLYSEKEMEITISDNGPGIPAEIQEKIFRPNFTTKSNGNGLGLAISKHIVEGSGGRITFATSEKGTTFFIYLRKQPN